MTTVDAATLSDQQRAIVAAGLDGPFVIDAGAGTGKTYTLVQRALSLVASGALKPSQLLVVTFMNKAATEIGDRLTVAFARESIAEFPTVATFHALAAAIVREFAYACGVSPDLHGIDDLRARAVFARAWKAFVDGDLEVDLSDFPLLQRDEVLPASLAELALDLKNRGITIDAFERDALLAARGFEHLPYGQIFAPGARLPRTDCKPKIEISSQDRAAEGAREAKNVVAVAALLRRFDALLERESLMTYGDLLARATAMLTSNPAVVRLLRERWRHALIDEFQDTNPQQLAFLRALFGETLGCVMAVGDVRQAIFEWNGADPQGIRRIARAEGTTVFELSDNRRSPQQVLDLAHGVLPDTDYKGTPLRATSGAATDIVVRHGAFTDGGTTAEKRVREAEAIACEIETLLQSGARAKDVVLLMRSRTHARIYASALAARGIVSKTHGGVGFFDAPEIRDAMAWLRLLDDPGDAFALVRVLQSPTIGLGDGTVAALFALGKPPADAVLVQPLPACLVPVERERVERLRAIVRALGPALTLAAPDAVRALVMETALDVAHAVREPALGRQVRANLAKLVALAVGFAHDRPIASLRDFLDEIDERDEFEIDEPEAELGGDEVSIMTIHAAKGLEWDYVFVANVAGSLFPSNGRAGEVLAKVDPQSGALAMRYDVYGRTPLRWIFASAPHDPATGMRGPKPPEKREEESRLFYVALTRAKRAVWISGASGGRATSPFLETVRGYCDGRPLHAAFGEDAAARDPVVLGDGPMQRERIARIVDRLTRIEVAAEPAATKLSYSAIAAYDLCKRQARYRYVLRIPDLGNDATFGNDADDDIDGAENDARAKLDPAVFGNVVHRVLQFAMQARIDGRPIEPDASVDEALHEAERESDAAFRARALGAVRGAVDALASYEPIAVEAEFDTTIAGVRVCGFIDLIARDPAGRVTIVDYKTGAVPDEHYALQLALYREAVAATYPGARSVLLRVGDETANFVEPELPTVEHTHARVLAAAGMREDVATPGVYCRGCPYAGDLCPEGARFAAKSTAARAVATEQLRLL